MTISGMTAPELELVVAVASVLGASALGGSLAATRLPAGVAVAAGASAVFAGAAAAPSGFAAAESVAGGVAGCTVLSPAAELSPVGAGSLFWAKPANSRRPAPVLTG